MSQDTCDIAVIGGGLAGSAAAVGFARQGRSVRLFERRDLARDPNRGDILHAPTVEILRRLDILGLLEERGAGRFSGLRVVDSGGSLDARSPIRESWLLNHAEMEAAFLEAAEAGGVDLHHHKVSSLTRDGSAGWLLEAGEGTTRARFVVGADGAESLTRRTLGIELADVHEYDNWIVVLHSPTPSWLEQDHGWTLLHPDGTVWLLPTTPVGRHRVIVSVARGEARDWMTSSEQELERRLQERHAPLGELRLNKRGGSHVYRIKRTHAAGYSGPRAALTGDAAHTLHPVGGQGLNLAIQDSARLAELVGPVLRDDGSDEVIAQALVEYEQTRRPINTATIGIAHAGSQIAGPGQEAYERALGFYGEAATDPDFMRRYHAQFGGRE
ncbi:MAG TPA: NAD(P)/FAD-dependent oxidoreductase [Acidimicrobiales bacterium]|nr:NAD(P)/FAD-dependent oxidoreductase [Acidimicrobiales bacterium]